MTDPLFLSMHNALLFAYSYDHSRGRTTALALMQAGKWSPGKGLSGLDGAAQSGMIQAAVRDLGELQAQIVICRYAPMYVPCSCGAPCCTSKRLNASWQAASGAVSRHAAPAMDGLDQKPMLWRALTARYFGFSSKVADIATMCRVNRDTVANHYSKLKPWLERNEEKTMRAVNDLLQEQGLVEGSEVPA